MPWTSDRRLYLTDDDQVVVEGDPRAVKLLIGIGGQLDDATAAKYGLTPHIPPARGEQEGAIAPEPPTAPAEPPDAATWDDAEEKAKPAPANKLKTKPDNK